MGLWLALPPPIGVWRVLYWMPGLNFVRVPSRFMVVGSLGLALVAAMGFDRLTIRRSAAARLAAAALCLALLVGEFSAVPRPTVKYASDVAPIDYWVGQQPGRLPLLDLPMSDSDKIQNREEWTTRIMLHSMAHYQPIFVGFSGIQPPGYMQMYWTLLNFPDAASIALARQIGLTNVILHYDLIPENERAALDARYAQFKDDVTLVHSEGDGRFYAITPAAGVK